MIFCKETYYDKMHTFVQLKKVAQDDPKNLNMVSYQQKVALMQ